MSQVNSSVGIYNSLPFTLLGLAHDQNDIQQSTGLDIILWKWTRDHLFSTKSLYPLLTFKGINDGFSSFIWQSKIPMKIAIFGWTKIRNRLNDWWPWIDWLGEAPSWRCLCPLWAIVESHDHIFGNCSYSLDGRRQFLISLNETWFPLCWTLGIQPALRLGRDNTTSSISIAHGVGSYSLKKI